MGDSTFRVMAVFAAFVQDELAQKETLDCKGSAGTKCCLRCQNITMGLENEPGDYLVDFKDGRPKDFVPHTSESYAVTQLRSITFCYFIFCFYYF